MTVRKLKLLLLVFFVALAAPTATLVYQAYGQLKWEAFHQHQQLARELSLRIDARFQEILRREQGRPFSDYSFFKITGSEETAFLQRSPLSNFPAEPDSPGLLGYFQVDNSGQLQTPTVPDSDSQNSLIDEDELRQRVDQEQKIGQILSQNRLVKKQLPSALDSAASRDFAGAAAEAPAASAPVKEIIQGLNEYAAEAVEEESGLSVFDSLSSIRKRSGQKSKTTQSGGRVADLELDDRYEVAAQLKDMQEPEVEPKRLDRKLRTEKTLLPEATSIKSEKQDVVQSDNVSALLTKQQVVRIRAFESEVELLEFSLLDSGHFVLFRRVWHGNERYVQGLLFDQKKFIESLIVGPFYESSLADVSDLIVSHQGDVVRLIGSRSSRDYSSSRVKGSELLYQTRLVAPFSEMELIYSLSRLPLAAGNKIVIWSAFLLALVLLAGTYMLFRLGARQINLAQQQQDFVSAVSHELKTPLTSIRMYGEMLREGWADETRRKSYYDFIFFESERLSRLINNVLQLARMTRRDDKAELSEFSVDRLLEEITPRIESQLQQAGFQLKLDCSNECRELSINIDCDWFTQIMINLVDNAIKFSANAEKKLVEISCRQQRNTILFSVRDYGPGIARDQIRKIFKLFYRSESELTRETVGTGIGLALVQQLVSAMHGKIDVLNREPGAEFQVSFLVAE
ncbi:MAG: HAMP domain-containing histidine kinase [Gammaproteobacteria bacterium]|nr:HAMP domain-containing histidine kinase [Gammaproteobacteria bacterium]